MDKFQQPDDRRKFIRVSKENIVYVSECDVREELNLQEQSEKIKCQTKDLSAGGLLFESSKLFEIGKILKLEIILPHWEKYKETLFKNQFAYPTKPFLVLGRVVRVEVLNDNLFDIGISFVGIEETWRNILSEYIRNHLA